jgi:Zn-dependent alcohol dehydrogenase
MEEPKDIQTQAYVVDHKGAPFVLQDVILDKVLPTEVLVEMKYTGLCHTVSLYCTQFANYIRSSLTA